MREPIENEYFNWLCAKVLERHTRMYYDLLGILYRTEFVYIVPPDEHRIMEGLQLREDFLKETGLDSDPNWEVLPCSVLELLFAFAQRASFQIERPVRKWFWEFIENLGLKEYAHVSTEDIPVINDILTRFIDRTYEPDGQGGMFPMTNTQDDQRQKEIWYQFNEYIDDRGLY